MVLWIPPPRFEIDMESSPSFLDPWFLPLQHSKIAKVHATIAKDFHRWYTRLIITFTETVCILTYIFDRYVEYFEFMCIFHNVLISPHTSIDKSTFELPFDITERDIMEGVANYQPNTSLPSLRCKMNLR
jgi:hypothetical protein